MPYVPIDALQVFDRSFTIYLIPETLRVTVFGIKSAGDSVNIEIESTTQAIVDTVEKVVARYLGSMGIQSQQSGNNAQAVVAQAAAAAQAVQQVCTCEMCDVLALLCDLQKLFAICWHDQGAA
jgi:hypothetical protein